MCIRIITRTEVNFNVSRIVHVHKQAVHKQRKSLKTIFQSKACFVLYFNMPRKLISILIVHFDKQAKLCAITICVNIKYLHKFIFTKNQIIIEKAINKLKSYLRTISFSITAEAHARPCAKHVNEKQKKCSKDSCFCYHI